MYSTKLNKVNNVKCIKRHNTACQAGINAINNSEFKQRRLNKVYGRLTIDREHVMYRSKRQ